MYKVTRKFSMDKYTYFGHTVYNKLKKVFKKKVEAKSFTTKVFQKCTWKTDGLKKSEIIIPPLPLLCLKKRHCMVKYSKQ